MDGSAGTIRRRDDRSLQGLKNRPRFPEDFADRKALMAQLVERVLLYETYSEVCCEKIGYSLADIHRDFR